MKIARTLYSVVSVSLIIPSLCLAVDPDFTKPSSDEELKMIQTTTLEIINNPVKTAEVFVERLEASPLYGWEADWRTTLKTLDLVGYYFSLEKAQFYASAGSWTPPPNLLQQKHLEFYNSEINKEAVPYSMGVLQTPFYKFAETLLSGLIEKPSPKSIGLIKLLLGTGREFWNHVVIQNVIPSPHASTALVAEILPSISKEKYHGAVDAVLSREDADPLLRVLMSHMTIRGELGQGLIHDGFLRNKQCADLLKSIRTEFEAKHLN